MDNRLFKESVVTEKTQQDAKSTCIDWYLVTTIYYTDGTTETTEEYLGTTCTGCDCEDIQCDCPDHGDGGGGGGGENPDEYDYVVGRHVRWTVATNAAWGSGSEIVGEERLKGKRVASEPQGGHFTGIHHYTSICNFCSINYPYDVWIEDSWSGSASDQAASSTVTGHLTYRSNTFNINKTGFWSFSAVFP